MKVFLPKHYYKDIFSINYNKLKAENIKLILFDLDNTICPPKENILSEDVKELFEKISSIGIKCVIFSNTIDKSKLKNFSNYYNIDVYGLAFKPFSLSYKKIFKKYKYKKEEICSVGDQLITDILGGNLAKIKTILVDPISDVDEKVTRINRKIEKSIFKKLKKYGFENKKYY